VGFLDLLLVAKMSSSSQHVEAKMEVMVGFNRLSFSLQVIAKVEAKLGTRWSLLCQEKKLFSLDVEYTGEPRD
jgi:hypothetical protein